MESNSKIYLTASYYGVVNSYLYINYNVHKFPYIDLEADNPDPLNIFKSGLVVQRMKISPMKSAHGLNQM